MRRHLITAPLALSVSLGVSSPTFAQPAQPAHQQSPAAKPATNPNEIICEKQEQLGSRLATQRVCKTRAEWAEERRLNRQVIEKAQTQRDLTH